MQAEHVLLRKRGQWVYTRRAMLRSRRFWASFAVVLATCFPVNASAGVPDKPVAAQPVDEDAADKEIERLYQEGKYEAAFKAAEKLVAQREAKFGKEHVRTASAISDFGAMYLAKGDLVNAEPLLKRAVEILEKAKDDALLTVALSNLASVYMKKGDMKRAETTLDRAIAIEQKAGPKRENELASLFAKMATLFMKTGRLMDAERLLQTATSIHEKNKVERSLFIDLTNLGNLYRGIGRYDKAADAYNRVLPIAEHLYGNKHPDVGKLYHSIGIFCTGSSQYAKAEESFARAEKLLLDGLGPKHPDVAAMYSDWAVMLTRTGQVDRALELRDKAQTIEEEWLANALMSGTDEDKLIYASRLEHSIDRVVSFQMGMGLASPKVTRFVLRTILRNKAQALEATAASTRALRERMTPENRKRFDDLVRIRGELASRYTRGPRSGQSVREFQAEVDQLKSQAETIDAEISKESAAYRGATKNVTVESVAEHIPEDAALVEFVEYQPYNVHFYSAASERQTTPRFMAYVLRHNGDVLRIQLPVDAYVINDKVAKIRKGLQDPNDKKVYRELSLLHDILFIRFLSEMPDAKHLLISPDGDLSLVPFGALLRQDGHFLAEKFNVTYLSSGRDVLRFGEKDRPRSLSTLVANPDYNAPGEGDAAPLPDGPRGSMPILARAMFPPLPGTAQEADAIRRFLPDPNVKLQQIATETALKQIAGPKILHVATHGFFLDESGKAAKGTRGIELDVPTSALPTAQTTKSDDSGERVRIVNPMFLSGLALAGANVRKGQFDDGILTAYEASALDLSGTELVVLSACETGVGSRVSREGVQGLRRALVLAGAETQVMSLWQVDDEATRDLMTMFYKNLFEKALGRSESLRQAQLAIFAQPGREHPFYWASFIVSGNWAPIAGVTPKTESKATVTNGKTIAAPPGGAKGCGCRTVDTSDSNGVWALMLSVLALGARRKRRDN